MDINGRVVIVGQTEQEYVKIGLILKFMGFQFSGNYKDKLIDFKYSDPVYHDCKFILVTDRQTLYCWNMIKDPEEYGPSLSRAKVNRDGSIVYTLKELIKL